MLEAEQIFQERYRLVRRLGQRSVRDTWLAVDFMSDPPHDVVIKFLGGGHALDWDHIKLFEREGNVLRSLEHPQIPAYREFFTLENHGLWFALIQDYIAGMSLAELVQQQSRLAEAQLRQIAEEVLAILEYLHEQSPPILHRDLKPSNLLLDHTGKVHLIDFGAVQNPENAKGSTVTVVGTYGYAPLEQFSGQAVPASDLYALGATLIHLATGSPPTQLPLKNLQIQFRDRVKLSPRFCRWLEQLTAPALENRYPSVAAARQELLATTEIIESSTFVPIAPVADSIKTELIALEQTAEKLQIRVLSRNHFQLPLKIVRHLFQLARKTGKASWTLLTKEQSLHEGWRTAVVFLLLLYGGSFLFGLLSTVVGLSFPLAGALLVWLGGSWLWSIGRSTQIVFYRQGNFYIRHLFFQHILRENYGNVRHIKQLKICYFPKANFGTGIHRLAIAQQNSNISATKSSPSTYYFGAGLSTKELMWLQSLIDGWLRGKMLETASVDQETETDTQTTNSEETTQTAE